MLKIIAVTKKIVIFNYLRFDFHQGEKIEISVHLQHNCSVITLFFNYRKQNIILNTYGKI